MEKQETMTIEQSLDVITRMINEAKGKVQRNAFYFLLWGWVVVIANVGVYILSENGYQHPEMIWAITIPAWMVSLWRMYSKRSSPEASTHLGRLSGWIWLGYGISLAVLIAFGSRINYQLNPVVLLMTAIPTFATGAILRFRPLVAGAMTFWVLGIVCFIVSKEMQPLINAGAFVGGYLLPGYLLKNKKDE
ncbi:MAG TPA: hypothetical protein VD927_01415 [Chryseosolibacter sp.]|nr:hypothetical protein [Chryseosolibacter sp.]